MGVCLVEVPYMVGDERHGGSRGPARLLRAGAARLLGADVSVARVERRGPMAASLAVNIDIARVVRGAAGRLPVVLAGSCDVAMGVLAGVARGRLGVVWIDAHGDFNTPESTITGFFPGMSLAVILGHCHADVWAQIGDATPIDEADTVLLGVRALDPAERERLERSAVSFVEWRDGEPRGNVAAALDALAARVEEVYLHIDMDAIDPEAAPGVVDPPVPGGISLSAMEQIVRGVTRRFRLRAATLATYNPEADRDDRTLRAALRILELLGRMGE